MPKDYVKYVTEESQTGHIYERDPLWQRKPLTPAQLLVLDVGLDTLQPDRGPMLEINEKNTTSLVPHTAAHTPSASFARVDDATNKPIEKQRFSSLQEQYGWIRHLRLDNPHEDESVSVDSAKCRWIHCSSTFPEYLRGFLWALSNDVTSIAASFHMLDQITQRYTRFSKHGRYFAPFSESLQPHVKGTPEDLYPMLIAVPFLDWTVHGTTPPLRFQVDRREGLRSGMLSAHTLRSVLQYYYRLEDTSDREHSQVFARHKPWNTNREMDLKIRRWYGHYPSGLNVDELWVLIIDPQHIVTFSNNQTWKSRWPALQFTSRVTEVSFRSIRNHFVTSTEEEEYTALTHAVASLSGAVGMMHRNFWPDIVLCLTDRYAGHLGHLQYRLHRAPSTKLVMDLIACQEELNIVIQITEQQLDMLKQFQSVVHAVDPEKRPPSQSSPVDRPPVSAGHGQYNESDRRPLPRRNATFRQISSSTLPDPIAQLLDNLERELVDLRDLRDNTDRLVTRTIQLVNIRLEDHGKAILVFTVVTIIFLPLNFVSSFFGMNVSDIRNMAQGQWIFWAVAITVTVSVLAASIFLAFSGGDLLEKLLTWRQTRREHSFSTTSNLRQRAGNDEAGFRVIGGDKDSWSNF